MFLLPQNEPFLSTYNVGPLKPGTNQADVEVGPRRLFFDRFDMLNRRLSSSVSPDIWSFW